MAPELLVLGKVCAHWLATGLPLVVCGVLKIVYDVALLYVEDRDNAAARRRADRGGQLARVHRSNPLSLPPWALRWRCWAWGCCWWSLTRPRPAPTLH